MRILKDAKQMLVRVDGGFILELAPVSRHYIEG